MRRAIRLPVVFGAGVNLAAFGIFDRDRPFGDVNRKLGCVHLALVRFNTRALAASAAQRAILATAILREEEAGLSLKIFDATKAVARACSLHVVNAVVAVGPKCFAAAIEAEKEPRTANLLKPIAVIFRFAARDRHRD